MESLMKKIARIISLSTAFVFCGCASTAPEFDEVITYDQNKSLAYNVMKQIDSHYKIKEAERPDESEIIETSVLGHLANTFILSPNFIATFGLSLAMDDAHGADEYHIIQAMDMSGIHENEYRNHVAQYFINIVKENDPGTELFDFDDGINGFTWKEKGPSCTKELERKLQTKIDEDSIYIDSYKERLQQGECYLRISFDFVGPANSKLFPEAINDNFVTIKMKPSWGHHSFRYYFDSMNNAYLYSPPREQWRANKYGGKTHPAIVQHKDKVYFFVKKEKPSDTEVFVDTKIYFSE
jgi:hypothetical protein